MTDLAWLPFLLQTSDASFPTGAYAHSLGFEEIVRLELVRDEATLGDYLRQYILPSLAEQELPYLRFAWEAGTLEELCTLDLEISAWKLPYELREASAQLGGRRLKALQTIHSNLRLDEFAAAISRQEARGHHLIISALQAHCENLPLEAALVTYAWQSLSGVCGAALKLIRIGQDGCQRVLRNAATEIPETIRHSQEVTRETAGWFNPLLEIAAMRHEFAGERLFIS